MKVLRCLLLLCFLIKVGKGKEVGALFEIDLPETHISTKPGYNAPQADDDVLNEAPIIGVLSQEISYYLEGKYPGEYESFIAASYVKFVEGGGARVIPIWINKTEEYYIEIMSRINGVLFPGGATWFDQSDGYADAGMYIYKNAKRLNDAGDYFPIWGTCLGFELLTYLDADRREHRLDCESENQGLKLEFERGRKNLI